MWANHRPEALKAVRYSDVQTIGWNCVLDVQGDPPQCPSSRGLLNTLSLRCLSYAAPFLQNNLLLAVRQCPSVCSAVQTEPQDIPVQVSL